MNAITDSRIVPYPATPPSLGGANDVVIDPFCENRILRVTDPITISGATGASTVSASESSAWSADGRAFYLLDRQSGGFRLYLFDPEQFTAQSAGKLTLGSPEFSFQSAGVIWGFRELQVRRLDMNTGLDTLFVDFKDYAADLDIPDAPRWYVNSLSVDYFDRRAACALGPAQDSNTRLLVYDLEDGLSWLETDTGTFHAFADAWSGTIATWTPFGIHDCRLSKNGDTLRSSGAGANARAFWRPGSALFQNVAPDANTPISGHMATGFDTYYGARLQSTPFQFIFAPLWNIPAWHDLMRPVPPAVAGWWSDYHIATRAMAADRSPLYISTYNAQGNPATPNTPPTSAAPGDNEIFAVASDGSGDVWRFGHHYSTGKGFYATPRGNVSPDGRFFLFASDWYMSLGGLYPNQRTDVFILELG